MLRAQLLNERLTAATTFTRKVNCDRYFQPGISLSPSKNTKCYFLRFFVLAFLRPPLPRFSRYFLESSEVLQKQDLIIEWDPQLQDGDKCCHSKSETPTSVQLRMQLLLRTTMTETTSTHSPSPHFPLSNLAYN